MTLRSRLSAAWRAFRQDDFPPPTLDVMANKLGRWAASASMADEVEKIRVEQEAGLANLEVPTIIRKRKKLASVPKE